MDSSSPPRKRTAPTRDRVRVTRACDLCKKKKLRCTGNLPCASCINASTECQYTAGYSRGKIPPILASTDVVLPHSETPRPSQGPEKSAVSSRNSPEPGQTDLDGHYVGPSSGVSFLLRAQKHLQASVAGMPKKSIFDFGDAPLPKYDPYFMILPSREEARLLVARYFDFAFPTHRFLHQPTVEQWLEVFYDRVHEAADLQPGDREVTALLLMVMAQGQQYSPDSAKGPVNSAAYFAASEYHLASEKGAVRLTSIQARLAQAFYLLSQSRINHAWSLFGTIVRLIFALGLHRRRRRNTRPDMIEVEMQKRVFWSAFSLDNYLSAALGRPRSFHAEDIDQHFPACSNDSEITRDAILPPPSGAQSIMLAPVSHAKLSKIISGILKDLYGISRGSIKDHLTSAAAYSHQLDQWKEEIGSFIELATPDVLIAIYQRQHTVLNLAYAHAQILLHRPFLTESVTFSRGSRDADSHQKERAAQHVQKCLGAASKILSILQSMCKNGRMYPAFWFTHYYSFSAIVVLYVYVIQNHTRAAEVYTKYFELAQHGQQDLSTCGGSSSFAQRSVMVLEELRKEVVSRLSKQADRSRERSHTNAAPATRDTGDATDVEPQLQPQLLDALMQSGEPQYQAAYPGWPSQSADSGTFQPSMATLHEQYPLSESHDGYGGMLMAPSGESPYSAQEGFPMLAELESFAMTGMSEVGYFFPRSDTIYDWDMTMQG